MSLFPRYTCPQSFNCSLCGPQQPNQATCHRLYFQGLTQLPTISGLVPWKPDSKIQRCTWKIYFRVHSGDTSLKNWRKQDWGERSKGASRLTPTSVSHWPQLSQARAGMRHTFGGRQFLVRDTTVCCQDTKFLGAGIWLCQSWGSNLRSVPQYPLER